MSYLAVDLSGKEYIFQSKPIRLTTSWSPVDFQFVQVPLGTVIRLTGNRLSWSDEPIELLETNFDDFYLLVCSCSGCSVDDLYKKTRKREIVWARQIIMAYRKIYLGFSLSVAGSEFGLDHCTVMHAIKKVSDLSTDSLYMNIFSKVFKQYPDLLKYKFKRYEY